MIRFSQVRANTISLAGIGSSQECGLNIEAISIMTRVILFNVRKKLIKKGILKADIS